MDRMEKRVYDAFQKRVDDDLACGTKSLKETFNTVNDDFAHTAGFVPYKSYQSYRNARSRNRKKK